MKTIRTVFATLACVFLLYFGASALLMNSNSEILSRTVFVLFNKTEYVALIMGGAFFAVAVIFTVAVHKLSSDSTDEDEEDEEILFADIPERPVKRVRTEMPAKVYRDSDAPVRAKKKISVKSGEESEDEFLFKDTVFVGAEYDAPSARSPKRAPESGGYCSYCGEKLPSGSNFCVKCGKRVE